MLESDIYTRRFKERAAALGHPTPDENEIEAYRKKGHPPSVAAARHYSKLRVKSRVSEVELEGVVKASCLSFGIDPEDLISADEDSTRDLKTVICHIAVEKLNIRPHTVIRKRLGMKNNSMVNHHLSRFPLRLDSIVFVEKLNESINNLDLGNEQ